MSEIHTPNIACHVLFGFVSQATMLSCHGLREGSEEERGKKKEAGKNGARALSLARKAHTASHPRRLTPFPMRVPGPFPSYRPPGSAVCEQGPSQPAYESRLAEGLPWRKGWKKKINKQEKNK